MTKSNVQIARVSIMSLVAVAALALGLNACLLDAGQEAEPATPVERVAEVVEPLDIDAGSAPVVEEEPEEVAAATRVEAPAPAPKKANLEVVDFVVGRNVHKRVPEGTGTEFNLDDGRLWGFVKVKNGGPEDKIKMVWKRNGKTRSTAELKVGTSPGWRTWSWVNLHRWDAGQWTVEVQDMEGNQLGFINFNVDDFEDLGC